MMKNSVTCITMDEVIKIKDTNGFLAELDGAHIKDSDDYLREISHALKFPEVPSSYGYYFDMITDMSWINDEDEIVLIIYNINEFLKNDLMLRNNLLRQYREVILPFWEEEVIHTVVDGQARPFNVYLVD